MPATSWTLPEQRCTYIVRSRDVSSTQVSQAWGVAGDLDSGMSSFLVADQDGPQSLPLITYAAAAWQTWADEPHCKGPFASSTPETARGVVEQQDISEEQLCFNES